MVFKCPGANGDVGSLGGKALCGGGADAPARPGD